MAKWRAAFSENFYIVGEVEADNEDEAYELAWRSYDVRIQIPEGWKFNGDVECLDIEYLEGEIKEEEG